jgi:predicted ArsR family transcriptional regulator
MANFETLQQTLAGLDRVEGVTVIDVMKLPAPLDIVLRRMMKEPLSLSALSAELQLPVDETHQLMDLLIEKGFVKTEDQSDHGGQVYRVYFARTRKLSLPDNLF